MREYKITGYMKPKGKENEEWQRIGDGVGIKLPDNLNPYEEIQKNFKLISSRWLFMVEEITNKNKE